ncbi:LacI family DNA-binding transcriptional regulator [Gracilibacillus sp. S3-1-1]|uniref:LacI family DNA-binding transcriptional regulator n=1 Tax=Gracilibacillus pellucidus TaxID=3095368 RepID=A0ACC6M822_9BACI|nr:LacI family DNA-binding transcriptional regulator [Gracilibacillus sp. S3-1-1]MDX8047136.1 LacI family DNA-binding transcriptional regulator [Gracilibacillus sp. S3-1-1]
MSNKITLQMIADAAGYSKYVVSKTLNDQPGVKESTRERILFVAKQLGYFKNNEQQIDVKGREKEGFVLVVMPNIRQQNFESFYWSNVFNGIVDYLDELKIGFIVISHQDNLIEHVKAESLLGIITAGFVSTQMLLKLSQNSVPIVMVDHEDPIIKADKIFMDNLEGSRQLTEHLIGLGHEKICFVGDINFSPSFKDRWQGFRNAMEHNQLKVSESSLFDMDYATSTPVKQQFSAQLQKWKEENTAHTALVCANDQIANGVIEVLIEQQYNIPEDISVTGFDNINYNLKLKPDLTTVHVLKETIGRRAVSMLLWRLEHDQYPNEKIQIACEMIIRGSVAPPKK